MASSAFGGDPATQSMSVFSWVLPATKPPPTVSSDQPVDLGPLRLPFLDQPPEIAERQACSLLPAPDGEGDAVE